jgi:tetratricopeptide (TPR) repeat protein
MSRLWLLVGCAGLAALLCAQPAAARYIRPDLEQVPVERLVENLTKEADANPKDATVRLNLARVHAMAFAQKTDTAEVNKNVKGQGAWFGYQPNHVPFELKKASNQAEQQAADKQLDAALADYRQTIALAPDNLTAKLGYAWCLDQAGKKDDALKEYRATIAAGWTKEKDLTREGLGWHSVVAEAAGYLMPHLDPEKDKAEIADLQEKIKKVNAVTRPITPLAVPLEAHLRAADLEARDARVPFDLDGSGSAQRWSWIKPNAAWLVYDARGEKNPRSGLHLFGNVTFWCFWDNGYQALSSLDDNGDGRLEGDELKHLALWCDRNGNGVADPGEVKSLADYGIVSLSCASQIDAAHPDQIRFSPQGVRFQDGETRPTFDLILKRQP